MKVFFLSIALLLAGCAAPSSTLVDEQGKQQTCSAFGWGWLGTPIAIATYADCVEKMEAAGYKKVDDVTNEKKVEKIPGLDISQAVAPRPVYDVGEHWGYRIKNPVTGNSRQLVEMSRKDFVRNKSVYVLTGNDGSRQILNEDLNLLEIHKDGQVILENTPEIKLYSWPLKVGQSWTTSGTRKTAEVEDFKYDMEVEVIDYGFISVPAGRFEAFYIAAKGSYGGALATELWYSPKARTAVKMISYFREGKVESELLNYAGE